jgi:hypothetical protein
MLEVVCVCAIVILKQLEWQWDDGELRKGIWGLSATAIPALIVVVAAGQLFHDWHWNEWFDRVYG